MATHRKAIVAVLVPVISWLALHIGLNLDPDTTVYVAGVLAGLLVAAVPNEPV